MKASVIGVIGGAPPPTASRRMNAEKKADEACLIDRACPARMGRSMKAIARIVLASLLFAVPAAAAAKLKALIVDGQNNHAVWPKSTVMMKQCLEDSGRFEVEVARVKFISNFKREEKWLPLAGAGESEKSAKPLPDPDFAPDFGRYAVVISNFGNGAADWPEATRRRFETYMKEGGGLVVVHAANNSWGRWEEFNKMIGLGGWGGRNQTAGPYVYFDAQGNVIRDAQSAGGCGGHGAQNEFLITMRDKTHPITKDLPDFWMHTKDECYTRLRGPAENMTILATAADTPALQKAGRNEPMLMVIAYGKGRVFHTTLGHDTAAFEGVGFVTTFLRGAEWAASGIVTQPVPKDFPSAEKATSRGFELKQTGLQSGAEDTAGRIRLFDGNTLAGWHVKSVAADRDKTFWTVKDGAIVCDSMASADHDYVWLLTDREYADFELSMKIRSDADSPGNSGIQVRSRYDDGANWLDGPQVDIHPPGGWRSGLIYDETRGHQRWIFPSLGDSRIQPAQGPQQWTWNQDGWNDIYIRCQGSSILTRINGGIIADYHGAGVLDDEAHRKHRVGRQGFIALQLHRRDRLRIAFKDIFIRPLPAVSE